MTFPQLQITLKLHGHVTAAPLNTRPDLRYVSPKMFFPVLVVVALSSPLAYSAPEPCSPSIMDECGRNIMFIGDPESAIPQDHDGLREFCSKELESDKCAKTYIRSCLKSLPQQLATMVVNSATKEVQSWCTDDRIDEIVELLPCISKNQPSLDTCMRNMVKFYDNIAASGDEDNMIPHACCEMDNLRNCLRDALTDCGQDSQEFLLEVVQAYASEAFDLACVGFESGSDKCTELPEVSRESGNATSKTVFGPLLGIIKSL